MRKWFLLIFILSLNFGAKAQTSGIDTLVQVLEKHTNYRFYFDKSELDSLKFSLPKNFEKDTQLFQKLFAEQGISYQKVNNLVFLKRGLLPNLQLPIESQSVHQPKEQLADSTEEWAVWENKLYVLGKEGSAKQIVLTGQIRNSKTLEGMAGVSILSEGRNIGGMTDAQGFYELQLPKGRHRLRFTQVGLQPAYRQIELLGTATFNVELADNIIQLEEATVTAQRESNVQSTRMGVQKVDIQTIKQIPVVFGEADVIKAISTLPGVKTVGEASTGLNVRGGSADQNLTLFNGTPIINPIHFFGIFSSFNPDLVKDVELFKGHAPIDLGGRLASVLSVNSKDGDSKKINGKAGLGLLTSRLFLEGPVGKKGTNFVFGGRTTYTNWLLKKLPEPYNDSRTSFYDVNLDLHQKTGDKSHLLFSAYLSNDDFTLTQSTAIAYGNKAFSLHWQKEFNSRFQWNTSIGTSDYNFSLADRAEPLSACKIDFGINQTYLKSKVRLQPGTQHTLDFGFQSLLYQIQPGDYQPANSESLAQTSSVDNEQALENSIFLSETFSPNDKWTLETGLRYVFYQYLGPQTLRTYNENEPKTELSLLSAEQIEKGRTLQFYQAPEVRVAIRYLLSNQTSLKASIGTPRQYIHAISNTASIAPTDIWKLSDNNIKPQSGRQVSIGVYKNLQQNMYEISLEAYYKQIMNFPDFKSGAQLLLNRSLETDLINTTGKAWGVEFLIRKVKGKLNGWLGYTWSRTLLKMDDPLAGELINRGEYYPANYDRPHDLTAVANYALTRRFGVSANVSYSTGRPVTVPSGVFEYAGSFRTLYLERNGFRIPDYFRADLGLKIDGNHKLNQKTHSDVTLGVYNLTGRKNPYSVYYVSEEGRTQGYKLSIFGSAIPYINYNIRF